MQPSYCPLGYQQAVTTCLRSPLDVHYLTKDMTLASQKVAQNQDQAWLALRVACGRCGGRQLKRIRQNLVECSDCHTKQWSILNLQWNTPGSHSTSKVDSPGIIKSFLIRLGFPQRAFVRYIPKATQFFWFRCINCNKTSTDYVHGYSGYFICHFCQSVIGAL